MTGMTQEEYKRVLPVGAASDFIGQIELASAAMQLGNVMRMSETTEKLPVVSFLPQAGFVNERYGGRKPATQIKWDVKEIQAEEIAATVAVPTAWIMDTAFDVEGQVEAQLSNAVAKVIDGAILWGLGAPTTFPKGVLGATPKVETAEDALDAIDGALGKLEDGGVTPSGIAASSRIGSALRKAYREAAALPGERPAQTLYGLPVSIGRIWEPAIATAIAGDWQYLAIGIREDITFGRSNDGVLMDATDKIVANAFQDNLTLIKIYTRLGCAIGKPIDPATNKAIEPFVGAKW